MTQPRSPAQGTKWRFLPSSHTQEDRRLDKRFYKTSITDVLKTKQADSCLSKKKKKEKQTKKKAGEGDAGRIHLRDPASNEAYGRDQRIEESEESNDLQQD